MDGAVDHIESVPESFIHRTDSVQLSVVWAHYCAVVANQLLARITEISQLLIVEEALLLGLWVERVHASSSGSSEGWVAHRETCPC